MRLQIRDEVGYRDDLNAESFRQPKHLLALRHAAARTDDLAKDARGSSSRKAGKIDSGLGVSLPLEDAALTRGEAEDVSGFDDVFRAGARVGEYPDGTRAIVRGNAGRDTACGADGNGEVYARLFLILADGDHEGKPQTSRLPLRDGGAQDAARVFYHRRERGRSRRVGRDVEVALVLASRMVDDNEHLALLHVTDRFGY